MAPVAGCAERLQYHQHRALLLGIEQRLHMGHLLAVMLDLGDCILFCLMMPLVVGVDILKP